MTEFKSFNIAIEGGAVYLVKVFENGRHLFFIVLNVLKWSGFSVLLVSSIGGRVRAHR